MLLTGSVGSGKTTTADWVAGQLGAMGVEHAVIDLDAIRRFWPTPTGDRYGFEMELRNLAPLVSNYSLGARSESCWRVSAKAVVTVLVIRRC